MSPETQCCTSKLISGGPPLDAIEILINHLPCAKEELLTFGTAHTAGLPMPERIGRCFDKAEVVFGRAGHRTKCFPLLGPVFTLQTLNGRTMVSK